MTKRPAKPDNASWVSPYITVQNPEAAITFYEKAFDFTKSNVTPDENGHVVHAEMHYKQMLIMLGKQGAWGSTTKAPASSNVECPIGLYIYVNDVDNFYKDAIKQGGKSVCAPEDTFWGDRMCRIKDPEGYIWAFATNTADFDPTKLPEHSQ